MAQLQFEKIAEKIKARRESLKISYQKLSDLTGLSKSTLQRYETGGIKNIPIEKLRLITDALKISLPELISDKEKNKIFVKIDDDWKEIEILPSFKLRALKQGIEEKLEKGKIFDIDFDGIAEGNLAVDFHVIQDKAYALVFDTTCSNKKVKTYVLKYLPKGIRVRKPYNSKSIIELCEKFFKDLDIPLKEKEETFNKLQIFYFRAKFDEESK